MNIMLVGNKADLIEGREVEYNEGNQKKIECNLDGFCEISAKNGEGIENLFKIISNILYNDLFNNSDISSTKKNQIKINKHEEGNVKKKCC